MNRGSLLYLAGPIKGLSYAACTDWRQYVMSKLPSEIIGISPMRCKAYLEKEQAIKTSYAEFPLSTSRGITTRDLFDVRRSDALLVNFLGATEISIGTIMEMTLAHELHKPIIVCMESDNIHRHAMLDETRSFILENLDEAIAVAVSVLKLTAG